MLLKLMYRSLLLPEANLNNKFRTVLINLNILTKYRLSCSTVVFPKVLLFRDQ